jgi:hypothetical protein
MSIETFINEAREFSEEIDGYFTMRPELVIALSNDAVRLEKIFELVPSFAALLDRYGLKSSLQEEFFNRDRDFAKTPSSLRLLSQVFGHPWQHVNLEQALADAVAATRVSLGLDRECDKDGACGDCECDPAEETPISVGITPDGNLAYTVSDEPLTLQEEANFIDTLRGKSTPIPLKMWEAAAGFGLEDIKKEPPVAEHDPVNKPKHYTTHPSGVECIEISEKLSFNLGNAFKYVFRRDDKENTLQDVSKAEWYLKREIGRLEKALEELPASSIIFLHPGLSIGDLRKADKVIAAESDSNAADYYAYLFTQGVVQEPDDLESLYDALASLQALIEEIKNRSE